MSRKSARNANKVRQDTSSQPIAFSSNRFWLVLTVLGLTVFLYAPTLNYGFLEFDDNFNVTENPDVIGFGLPSMIKMFQTTYLSMYTPLTMLTYGLNHLAANLQAGPYHLTNLLLHLLCGIAVYFLMRTLTQRTGWSFVAAAVFLIHPIQVESVAWISARSTPLYALFYILALVTYVQYLKTGENARYYVATAVLFCLSLLSKPSAVSLPVILLAFDYWYGRTLSRKLILEKVPLFAVALIFSFIAINVRPHTEFFDNMSYGALDTIALSSYSYLWYLVRFIWPIGLSAFVPFPVNTGNFLPWPYYAAILPWIVAIVLCVRYRNRFKTIGPMGRAALLGCALFLIPNAMVIVKVFSVIGQLVADRYAYVPYIGLCLLIAVFGAQLQSRLEQTGEPARRRWQTVGIGVGLIGVLGLSLLTSQRVAVWANDIVLWSDVIAKDPTIASAYYMRGDAKADRNDNVGALADIDQAIALNPKFATAYARRGHIKYFAMGDRQGALADFDKALETGPADFRVYFERGSVKGSMGRYAQAIDDFDRAAALQPNWPVVYYVRAMAELALKQKEKACTDLRRAADGGIPAASVAIATNCPN